jgi:hypothetical protein
MVILIPDPTWLWYIFIWFILFNWYYIFYIDMLIHGQQLIVYLKKDLGKIGGVGVWKFVFFWKVFFGIGVMSVMGESWVFFVVLEK